MRRRQQGMSLVELLVMMALTPLVLGLVFKALRATTHLYQSNFNHSSAEQEMARVSDRLQRAIEASAIDGIHLTPDGESLVVQTIAGVSGGGKRVWSPTVEVFRFEGDKVFQRSVALDSLGVEVSDSIPQSLNSEDLSRLGEEALGGQQLAHHLVQFQVTRQGDRPWVALEMESERQASSKLESVKSRTRFALMSSLGR